MPVTALTPRRDDLALEGVQPVVAPVGQLDERDRLGHFDDVGERVRAEAVEAAHGGGGVGAGVAAAEAAGVGQRVLDRVHAPAFLVEHPVVEDAADGQFRVLLDRIVLEVLVAAVAVEQIIASRDSAPGCRGTGPAPWRADCTSSGL